MNENTIIEIGKLVVQAADAFGAKEIIVRALRQPADAFAAGVARIISNAMEKLGERAKDDGRVPTRSMLAILEESRGADDDLFVEYFGGVLASSKTPLGRDDRGAALAKLVGRLTVYQLRAHHLLLWAVREHCKYRPQAHLRSFYRLTVSDADLKKGMDFGDGEDPEELITHIKEGLLRENLLEDLVQDDEGARAPNYFPTKLAIELFVWAAGHGDKGTVAIFDKDLKFPRFPEFHYLNPTHAMPVDQNTAH